MGWGVGRRGNWETAGATGESIVQYHVEVKGEPSFGERRIRGKGSLETRAEGCDDERAIHEASEGTFPSGLGKGDRWWAWLGLGKKRLQTDLHLSRLPWWLRGYSAGDLGSIPGSGSSPGGGNGNPLQYSCLENPMDGGAWWVTVHGVAKSRT